MGSSGYQSVNSIFFVFVFLFSRFCLHKLVFYSTCIEYSRSSVSTGRTTNLLDDCIFTIASTVRFVLFILYLHIHFFPSSFYIEMHEIHICQTTMYDKSIRFLIKWKQIFLLLFPCLTTIIIYSSKSSIGLLLIYTKSLNPSEWEEKENERK